MRGLFGNGIAFFSFFILLACQRSPTSESTPQTARDSREADKLVILSPHRKSIQEEFIPRFQNDYKNKTGRDVRVDWLDQGGTSAGIRFLRARYASKPETSDVDLFWGGGASSFIELDRAGFLERYELSKELQEQVPEFVAGVALRNPEQTWHATAISGFGIFFNKRALQIKKLEAPKTWEDLVSPQFFGQVSLTDPRQSGSASIMNMIILESLGWQKGWEVLTGISANANHFTHSSSDPIKAIVSGEALAALVIDFYAAAQIAQVGSQNLGFHLPEGKSVLDPDPIAILKGAPNRKVAEMFIEFSMNPQEQALLMLPQGAEGGPRRSTLGRMGINKKAYEQTQGRRVVEWNPFDQKESFKMDMERAARLQRVLNDLVGAIFVDTHADLKRAWSNLLKQTNQKPSAEQIWEFSKPPLTQKELLDLSNRWDDDRFRNANINRWVEFAKNKYRSLGTLTQN
jgi:ABC-type Fe3+ transport system substrate-binding protein